MLELLSLQLQLQRNEVIALVNLLNRLSESIKYVCEQGPSIEKIMERQISDPSETRYASTVISCLRFMVPMSEADKTYAKMMFTG